MKSGINFLVCALLLLTVIACKDDDDDTPASLVGTWAMTEFRSDDGVSSFELLGIPVTGTFMFHGLDYNTTTTFTENPNEFSSTGDYTFEFTSNILGEITKDTITVDAFVGTGEWSVVGNTLTQIFEGDTVEFEIVERTNNLLRLKLDLDETIEESGIIITNTGTVHSTFEKQ